MCAGYLHRPNFVRGLSIQQQIVINKHHGLTALQLARDDTAIPLIGMIRICNPYMPLQYQNFVQN